MRETNPLGYTGLPRRVTNRQKSKKCFSIEINRRFFYVDFAIGKEAELGRCCARPHYRAELDENERSTHQLVAPAVC